VKLENPELVLRLARFWFDEMDSGLSEPHISLSAGQREEAAVARDALLQLLDQLSAHYELRSPA